MVCDGGGDFFFSSASPPTVVVVVVSCSFSFSSSSAWVTIATETEFFRIGRCSGSGGRSWSGFPPPFRTSDEDKPGVEDKDRMAEEDEVEGKVKEGEEGKTPVLLPNAAVGRSATFCGFPPSFSPCGGTSGVVAAGVPGVVGIEEEDEGGSFGMVDGEAKRREVAEADPSNAMGVCCCPTRSSACKRASTSRKRAAELG